jgi:hypothetical protein
MRHITKKILTDILEDPFYKTCIRKKTRRCAGRITLEHAIIYAGRQVDEKWAILPVCAYNHCVDEYQDCGDIDKRFHEWVALSRMTEEYRKKYPRGDWERKLTILQKTYGIFGEKRSAEV